MKLLNSPRILVALLGLFSAAVPFSRPASASALGLAFAPVEMSFQIEHLTGDPFDYVTNDVRLQIKRPDGSLLSLPAFYDGGSTWRVRCTPDEAGAYRVVSALRNGAPLEVVPSPAGWKTNGPPALGFVSIDPKAPRRFQRGGEPFFPLGHNQGWQLKGFPDVPALFDKMGAAGENWSRVWMNNWDGKNLDWLPDGSAPSPPGTLSLEVARRWDAIVSAAERNGIAFQLVLFHHGQYSTHVDPCWNNNPYNVRNGGFLKSPEDFFTDERARALTKRKLRYAVARWGYSPAIMAWELFNEVHWTDAAREGHWDVIAAWHKEMADFLRSQDAYHHLITTSASDAVPAPVWASLDYYQDHVYRSDLAAVLALGNQNSSLPGGKPYFVGEFGPTDVHDPTGVSLHAGLWAGLMSGEAGAPEFWTWEDVERNNLYSQFAAATGFVKASGLSWRGDMVRSSPPVSTPARCDLVLRPGGDWGPVTQCEFSVTSSGPPAGFATLSSYIQGDGNRSLGPSPLVLHVASDQPGEFLIRLAKVAKSGAHLKLRVDDTTAEKDYPPAQADYLPSGGSDLLSLDIPAGSHTITISNTGADWVQVQSFNLTNYATQLASYALSDRQSFLAWVYNRSNVMGAPGAESNAVSGALRLTGLAPGTYRATWWDTRAGKVLRTGVVQVGAKGPPPELATPPVRRDVALYVVPAGRNP